MRANGNGFVERACAGLLFLTLLGSCAAQVAGELESDSLEGEGEVTANAQAIQEAFVVGSQTATQRWVNLLFSDSMSMVGKSVGVISHYSKKGYQVSCGVTFISPQYAVTAAHCVAKTHLGDPPGQFMVYQINTSALSSQALTNQLTVTGTWPSWSHAWLGPNDGYVTTQYACSVAIGCHSGFHRTANCPTNQEVDMALIKCPTRKTNATYGNSWALVHTNNTNDKQVETWWFHEVHSLATLPTGVQPGPAGNWANYGSLAVGQEVNNFHYRFQNYLPLRSSTWPDGTPYKQIGLDGTETKSDTPVCHGTSGSGVFERGTTLLFGPTIRPGAHSAIPNGFLCENMPGRLPGQHLSNHIRATHTIKLENTIMVQNDRP